MLCVRSITPLMLHGSIPVTMTPARLDALDAMTSPWTTGVAPVTPGTFRTAASVASKSAHGAADVVSMTIWALLPRIFLLRSWLKPPMTLTTLDSAHDEIATPQIDRTLITVKKPLFCDRTCL